MDIGVAGLSNLVEIGRGGFGTVYQAREGRFDRDVALKVIRESGISDEVVARFGRECRALGSLSGHPNIVALHDSGRTTGGDLYLLMEFLPGGSLTQRVHTGGPASAEDVVAWGTALAGALESAHRGGVVHRDVKPENVLFSGVGAPKLVDFGIARMHSAYETRSGTVSATIAHAAPEVIAGAPATPQTDVYGLASVLFYALAGTAPFVKPGEDSLYPLIFRITTMPPPDLRKQGVPDAVAGVVERGLAKDVGVRYASAAAFGEALQQAARTLRLAIPHLPVSVVPAAQVVIASDDVTQRPPKPSVVTVGSEPDTEPKKPTTLPMADAPPDSSTGHRRRTLVLAALASAAVAVVAVAASGIVGRDTNASKNNAASNQQPPSVHSSVVSSAASGARSGTVSQSPAKKAARKAGTRSSPAVIPVAGAPATPFVGGGNPVVPGAPAAVLPANRPPTLSVASRTNNELDSVGATFVANDPDGDPVTLAVSGLPSGLSASGGNVSGRIAHNAATVTTLKTSIQSRGFTVVVTATDSHGSRTTRSLTWTVRDTHRTMPNYIGQYGCRGCGGLPDIADISHPDPRCAADPAGDQNLIWRQGVAPGAVILWGQPITYWYGPAPSGGCENVAKGW